MKIKINYISLLLIILTVAVWNLAADKMELDVVYVYVGAFVLGFFWPIPLFNKEEDKQ